MNKAHKSIRNNLPRVSIVTPSYNQGRFVERTILSVLNQDYPNLQYIFVDALSNDSTPRILKQYACAIDVVIEEKDDGQSDALNKGFAHADGDILAYINSDDCYASSTIVSDAVAQLSQASSVKAAPGAAAEGAKADVIYGRRYYINENGFFHNYYPFREFNEQQLYQACYLPQECCFWTREIFERAGAHINKELQFAMDYELWLRFLKAGAKFRAVDEIYALFRWHDGQKSNAAWQTSGLPEIASLQNTYCGQATDEKEMSRVFMEHYSGFNARTNPAQFDLFESLWGEQTRLTRLALGQAPLDHWMFMRASESGLTANQKRTVKA